MSTPFSFDSEKVPPDVQLELIDIQCDLTLKEKFSTSTLDSFYGSLNETQFPNLRRHARRMLVLFGSTYVWEQTFSVMNYKKSRYRSRLTDEHLSSCVVHCNITNDARQMILQREVTVCIVPIN